MRLGALLKRYAGQPPKTVHDNSIPLSPALELPPDITDWPPEWQKKLKENVRDLCFKFDLDQAEAEEAALSAVQYEFMKSQGTTINEESDHD